MEIHNLIHQFGVVPVLTFRSVGEVSPTLSAIREGGLNVAEICFRTDCATDAIREAIRQFPDMLIGAGSVVSEQQCRCAIDLGVRFVVSPGLSDAVAALCAGSKIAYYPGVATPTEVMRAMALGLDHIKIFPAGLLGGKQILQTYQGVFPSVQFMPTGGVNVENLSEYLICPNVFACGGTWLQKGDVYANCRQAVEIVQSSRL